MRKHRIQLPDIPVALGFVLSMVLGTAGPALAQTSRVDPPGISPLPGFFYEPVEVTLVPKTQESKIRYTLDGSDPVISTTAWIYEGPITLAVSTTLRCVGYKDGYLNSETLSGEYQVVPPPKLPVPLITPQASSFTDSLVIALASQVAGATLSFSTDGSTPDLQGHIYAGPIIIRNTTTIKVVAHKAGYQSSDILTSVYTYAGIPLPPPSANPPGGNYSDSVVVTLSAKKGEAKILYTLDGSNPTQNSPLYAMPILLKAAPVTLKAVAYYQGLFSVVSVFTFNPVGSPIRPVSRVSGPTRRLGWPSAGSAWTWIREGRGLDGARR